MAQWRGGRGAVLDLTWVTVAVSRCHEIAGDWKSRRRLSLRPAMRRIVFLLLAAAYGQSEENVIKIPVQVDQNGKQIFFTTNAESDVAAEARKFCSVHLPSVDMDECLPNLMEQVRIIREQREQAQKSLPGLSFTVNNARGETIKFIHEEGADAALEAKLFCAEHFPEAPERDCVEHMLKGAARALDEINDKLSRDEL